MLCIVDVVMKCFGVVWFCLVVVGLNLYVGEGGFFGSEEIDYIVLVVVVVCVEGIDVCGFFVFDIVFMWVC